MKKIFKIVSVFFLLIFSFYYIDKINYILASNSNLMNEIKNNIHNYNISPVNAVISDNEIIPGINGVEVDILKSYYNMRDYLTFNENYLVYTKLEPEISIIDNYDKYITRGNVYKRNISIIINNNDFIEKYLLNNNKLFNKLITYKNYKKSEGIEYINNDIENFSKLDNLLNNNLCIINNTNNELCREYKYYLININEKVNNDNYIDVKNNLYSGQIIYIDDYLSLDNFRVLYQEILFKSYNIVYLSILISE